VHKEKKRNLSPESSDREDKSEISEQGSHEESFDQNEKEIELEQQSQSPLKSKKKSARDRLIPTISDIENSIISIDERAKDVPEELLVYRKKLIASRTEKGRLRLIKWDFENHNLTIPIRDENRFSLNLESSYIYSTLMKMGEEWNIQLKELKDIPFNENTILLLKNLEEVIENFLKFTEECDPQKVGAFLINAKSIKEEKFGRVGAIIRFIFWKNYWKHFNEEWSYKFTATRPSQGRTRAKTIQVPVTLSTRSEYINHIYGRNLRGEFSILAKRIIDRLAKKFYDRVIRDMPENADHEYIEDAYKIKVPNIFVWAEPNIPDLRKLVSFKIDKFISPNELKLLNLHEESLAYQNLLKEKLLVESDISTIAKNKAIRRIYKLLKDNKFFKAVKVLYKRSQRSFQIEKNRSKRKVFRFDQYCNEHPESLLDNSLFSSLVLTATASLTTLDAAKDAVLKLLPEEEEEISLLPENIFPQKDLISLFDGAFSSRDDLIVVFNASKFSSLFKFFLKKEDIIV
jgi:hypothetical protein